MDKDPQATLDYALDWSRWLGDGDTIVSATWNVQTGITKDRDSVSSKIATVWLSGGTAGRSYVLTCRIITVIGREDERSLTIRVRER